MDTEIELLTGTATLTSQTCPFDEHDCCVNVLFTGVSDSSGDLVADWALLFSFAEVIDADFSQLLIQRPSDFDLGGLFGIIDFRTAELFEAICPELGGEICCHKDCEAKMDPHFKVSTLD